MEKVTALHVFMLAQIPKTPREKWGIEISQKNQILETMGRLCGILSLDGYDYCRQLANLVR